MLRVEYADAGWAHWSFVADDLGGQNHHLCIVFRNDGGDIFVFVTKQDEVKVGDGIRLIRLIDLRDPTTGVRYKLTPMGEDET